MESNLATPVVCALIAALVAVAAFASGCSSWGGTNNANGNTSSNQTAGTGATNSSAGTDTASEETITSLSYAEYGTAAEPYFSYKITTTENGQAVLSYSADMGQSSGIGILSQAQLTALDQALSNAGVASWDGFRGSNPNVLDGSSFSFWMNRADGTRVSASGSNNFPTGYRDTSAAIKEAFDQVISQGLTVDESMTYERQYRSFDGGGPRYYARLSDWDVVSSEVYTSRDANYDETAEGSALYYNLQFMAKSPGQVTVQVFADGPLESNVDEPYEEFTLTVDDNFHISVE